MPSTVLGKRSRSVEHSPECVQTRSKRQAQSIEVHNDENEAPVEVTIEVAVTATPRKQSRVGRPAKHGSPNGRVPSSPVTIDAHFTITKSSLDRNENKDFKSTPQTPRHRDALSKKIPITPRHRISLAGSPKTPRTPSTPSNAHDNPYNQARQMFSRCSDPGTLVGRDTERQELKNFVAARIDSGTGGCLYVSGPPGTGKSALVNEISQEYSGQETLGFSIVNCMSVKTATDLAKKLREDLKLDFKATKGADFEHLRQHFFTTGSEKKSIVVVLDEVDRLVDLDLKLLYNLFEWSMQKSSNLILVGIANALDLTDRLLPKLKSRNLKPNLLPFMPYTAAQIAEIITSKLKSISVDADTADFIPFLHPAAIQFCSKKVAAQTGDLRKAFDICKRAIDLAEQDAKTAQAKLALQQSPSKTPLMENINLSSPPVQRSPVKTPRQLKLGSSLAHLTTQTAPRASIAHMAKVTSAVFSNGTTQRLQSLNIQQKAVLCSLAAAEKKRRDSASQTIFATPSKTSNLTPTIKQLFDIYSSLCKRENLLHPLTSVEFRDVVSGLETLSLVSAVEGKNGSFASFPITPSKTPSRKGKGGFGGSPAGVDEKRMASCVGFQELMASLQGPGSEILKDILDGVGLA